jgi:hypothetical protein
MKKTMKKTMVKKATAKKPMMQKGGVKKSLPEAQKGKTTGNPKSYWEGDSGKKPVYTNVEGPNNYKKEIQYEGGNENKPYSMTVTKGGKTNKFQLTEQQALRQREIAKKEAGQKKKMGGSTAGKTTPLYPNNPLTEPGRMVKKGGVAKTTYKKDGTTKKAVSAGMKKRGTVKRKK